MSQNSNKQKNLYEDKILGRHYPLLQNIKWQLTIPPNKGEYVGLFV